MATIPDPAPESGEDSPNGVRAVVLIGCVMVGVYLLSSALQVYERDLLNTLFPYSSQFAFLRGLFPSPWSDDLIDWQNIALFEVVPFLLFFYFAVRMRIDPMGRVLPMVIAMVVVGVGLSFFSLVLGAYQDNISSLLLDGSFVMPHMSQTNPLVGILSLISSVWELGYIFESGVLFAALGMTGIAFGSFSGETPYWILKSWFASRGPPGEEVPVPDDTNSPEPAAAGTSEEHIN
jgi:hypothetical protein